MKCKNCSKEIEVTMKYCPYCSYNINNLISSKTRNIIVFLINFIFVLGVIFSYYYATVNEKTKVIESMCNKGYEVIYKIENEGIYQSKNNNIYYIDSQPIQDSEYTIYQSYQFGYTKDVIIESFFMDSIYFFREKSYLYDEDELIIALVANSEKELIEKYTNSFYRLANKVSRDTDGEFKKMNLKLTVYYNDSFEDVKTTYEKLFFLKDNIRMPKEGYGIMSGEYRFLSKNPAVFLNRMFKENKENVPETIEEAMNKNRHIDIYINANESDDFDDFKMKLENSFQY